MSKIFTFKNKRTLPLWLAWLLSLLLRFYRLFIRLSIDDPHHVMKTHLLEKRPCIFAFWHNRALFAPVLLPGKYKRQLYGLVSSSRDGEYMSQMLRALSIKSVRGSSSKGGFEALQELAQLLRRSKCVLLTVDGPRGPMYSVHPGAASLAQHAQAPVVPLALNYKRYWHLKSWDKMQIPKPFTSACFTLGEPILIPQDMPIETANELIRQKMMDITRDS